MGDIVIETKTPEKIHKDISTKLARGVPYIDALVDYAQEHNLEIETIAEIVKKSVVMREKIKDEALKMRLVKPDVNPLRQLCE